MVLKCVEHEGCHGLTANPDGETHGVIVPVPVSLMEKEGTYRFVLHFYDDYADSYKNHKAKPALEVNAVYDPMIDAVSLHFHPSPDHNAHYDRHKYPLSNRLIMLRAIVRVTQGNKWFSHSRYTQQSADNCWWTPLPMSPTSKWTWGQPTFKWFLIMPIVDRRFGDYTRADEVLYEESEIQGWPEWGPTRNFEPGTRRYRAEVTYRGRTISSPGARSRRSDGYIPASEAKNALRMSVRDAHTATNSAMGNCLAWSSFHLR